MSTHTLKIVVIGLLVVGLKARAEEQPPRQEQALAEIQKMGGEVTVDQTKPGKPVVAVVLHGSNVTDDSLVHLQGLSQLRRLRVSLTKVTGAGLKHLKGCTQLEQLDLNHSDILDAGLEHLKPLTSLQKLDLHGTSVTDKGLEHLKGLAQLQTLNLDNAMVTGGGYGT